MVEGQDFTRLRQKWHSPNQEGVRVGDSIQNNLPRGRLSPLDRILLRIPIKQHIQVRNFGDPTAIGLPIEFDLELHSDRLSLDFLPRHFPQQPRRRLFSPRYSRRLAFHHDAQDTIDSRLITFAVTFQPDQDIRVQPDRQLLFLRRPCGCRLFQKGFVESRYVRVVNIGVFHSVNSCQVAFDRFLAHGDFLSA